MTRVRNAQRKSVGAQARPFLAGRTFLASSLAWLLAAGPLGSQAPARPDGLWQDQQRGMVMKLVACGDSVCGVIAGIPAGRDTTARPEDEPDRGPLRCGATLLDAFQWKASARRWEGKLSPPNVGRRIGSHFVVQGDSLTLKARMLLVTRTMTFVRFGGKVSHDCRVL